MNYHKTTQQSFMIKTYYLFHKIYKKKYDCTPRWTQYKNGQIYQPCDLYTWRLSGQFFNSVQNNLIILWQSIIL